VNFCGEIVLKKSFPLLLLFVLFVHNQVHAQETIQTDDTSPVTMNIISVNDIKKKMSEMFESIKDYTADFEWINGNVHYNGSIKYKKPDKILLNFAEPRDQKIVSDGQILYIYIPYLKVVIQQMLTEDTESEILMTGTETGLSKLFDEYSFSFYDSSSTQPFRNTRAYHLRLVQKTPKVGFEKMDIWVAENGQLLQSNGRSPNGVEVSLIFSNIQMNTELPDYIFEFDVPADAQIIRNIIVPFSSER
jgi:outer membrane lipoprotein-sorting protein